MLQDYPYIPDGLVLDWKPEGLASERRGRAGDRSLAGNHGAHYGSPALYFDGAGDYAAGAYVPVQAAQESPFVIEAWVYNDGDTGGTILHNFTTTGSIGQHLQQSDDGLRLYIHGVGGYETSAAALATDAWNHVLVTYDGSAVVFVINGAVFGSGGAGLSSMEFEGCVLGAFIGDPSPTYTDEFTGKLACVALTSGAVAPHDLYALVRPPAFTGYVAFWLCDEGAGAALDNAEGTAGYDLTITGATWDRGANPLNESGRLVAGGLVLDGANHYGDFGTDASLHVGAADCQIHVWATVNSTQAEDYPALISHDHYVDTGGWSLQLYNKQHLRFKAKDDGTGGSDITAIYTGTAYNDDARHLFSAIRSGGVLRIYVDGVQRAEDTTATASLGHWRSVKVGASLAGENDRLAGTVARAMLGRATMTFAQAEAAMQAIYAQGAYL